MPALDHQKKSGQNLIRGQQGRIGSQQVLQFPGSGQTDSLRGCSLFYVIQKQREGRNGRLGPATPAGSPNPLPSWLVPGGKAPATPQQGVPIPFAHVLRHL